jgi:hypothetical protein
VDTQPNEVTVALRKRRLAGHDRERHVEGIDVVQLALDDDVVGSAIVAMRV